MRIRLSKDVLLRARCYFWEAERSVHVLLDPKTRWPDFVAYYDTAKRSELGRLVQELTEKLPRAHRTRKISREDFARTWREPGTLRVIFGPWLSRWQYSFAFNPFDIEYLVRSLSLFLEFLQRVEKPDTGTLISLRMQLCECGLVIERRCSGWKKLEEVKEIASFGWTHWRQAVSLTQFLAKSA